MGITPIVVVGIVSSRALLQEFIPWVGTSILVKFHTGGLWSIDDRAAMVRQIILLESPEAARERAESQASEPDSR